MHLYVAGDQHLFGTRVICVQKFWSLVPCRETATKKFVSGDNDNQDKMIIVPHLVKGTFSKKKN